MTVVCHELFKVHHTAEGDAAALQGLTLHARPGELLAVLGPSGSGKSTLLRILAGLERPSAGQAVVAGHDISRLSARARARVRSRHIGFVGQHAQLALSPVMTIEESLTVPLRLRGHRAARARSSARELIERVSLPAAALRTTPYELSGGERQRAALCVAVAHQPDVVLADEPTGDLDAEAAAQVLALLRELAEHATTVLMVTHDPAGAASADRVVRVRDGRVSSEDAGSGRAVVIGKGGWLHVPEEVLARAGIGRHALLRGENRAVVLEALDDAIEQPTELCADAWPSRLHARPSRVAGAEVALDRVSKRYGSRHVFREANFQFAAQTFTAVTGRSGSGKSTLLRMVCGLELPDAGTVTVASAEVSRMNREQRAARRATEVGVVAQDVALAGFLTSREQVALPLLRAGRPREQAEAAASRWLAALGVADRELQRVGRLSAGERQRVALARAVAGERRLLVVDEPTSRLDEANAAAVASLLRALADDFGITVLCATHDPVVAEAAHCRVAL